MRRLALTLLAVSMLTGCLATTKLSCPPVQVQYPQPAAELLQLPADPVLLEEATGSQIEAVHQLNAKAWAEQRSQLARLIAWVRKVGGRDPILDSTEKP